MAFVVVFFAVFAGVCEVARSQFFLATRCTNTQACSPPVENIASGVVPDSTNTCGLEESERFCHQIGSGGQIAGTCDYCDASNPELAHGPELMTDEQGTESFWQSQSFRYVQYPGFVNITLSFNKTYELRNIDVVFQYIRPDSMAIYRSTDYGATFTPYQYFSNQCPTFYDTQLHDETLASYREEVLCTDSYSEIIPLSRGKVYFNPQDYKRGTDETFYNLPDLQEWITFTDIRLKLDRMNTFGDERFGDPDVISSYYYSISDLKISGVCKCNGHASRCEDSGSGPACVCEHNTEGRDCDRCQPFYQDRPWARGTESDPHICVSCDCNSHSGECHLDEEEYVKSGNVSGGICDNCRDNTEGKYCEKCKDTFYRNPAVETTDPSTCIPCDCDPRGTEGGALGCLQDARDGEEPGKCRCKENVETRTCSECKDGYFNLNGSNPDGCSDCNCNAIGTRDGSRLCNKSTGQCPCKANVQLLTCSECKLGFFSFSSVHDEGCIPCDCDAGGSVSPICDPVQGDCMCRPNISSVGREVCDTPDRGFYCPSIDHITYEAEFTGGTFYSDVVEGDERQYTGLGFARLEDGEEAAVSVRVPFSGFYRIVLRYSVAANSSQIDIRYAFSIENCTNGAGGDVCQGLSESTSSLPCSPPDTAELVDWYNLTLVNGSAVASDLYHCFVAGRTHTVAVRPSIAEGSFLLDSVVLIPNVEGLKVFENQTDKLESYLNQECIQTREMLGTAEEEDEDFCKPLTCSATFEIHDGALPCECDENGSVSQSCDRYGGQCSCKEYRSGRMCDQCEPGRGGPDCELCNCNSLGSLSAVCNTSGQCFCKPAVEGEKCDRCIPDHYNFESGQGCRSCDCHVQGSLTSQCDLVTGVCQCKPGVEGAKCDRCMVGYYGLDEDGCKPCVCDVNGTEPAICNPESGQCLCKENVRGLKCNRCVKGYFGLSDVLEEGCLQCSCSVGTNACDLIENLRQYIISPSELARADFSLVKSDFSEAEGSNLTATEDGDISVSVDLTSPLDGSYGLFLEIPKPLLQDLSRAFSFAQLKFTLQLNTDHVLPFPVDDSIALIGDSILQYTHPDPLDVGTSPVDVSIDLIGEGWSLDNVPQDITDMQRLVRDIESLAVRVGYFFGHETYFSNISLEFTVLSDDPALPLVEFREKCVCPSAYSGLSCEMCAQGYYRNRKGVCKPCDCNGNSESCVAATGVCFNCTGNTRGEHCEDCLPKHYRDPRDNLCKPCPCPGIDDTSQYATTCSGNLTGDVVCHDCRVGHAGDRCDVCAPGYFGDPAGLYGDHRPCITCQCNGNADPMVFPICERLNGTCINCTNHSYGRECERCEPGYYGDAIVAKNCTACSQCVVAGVDVEVCNPGTGDCSCDEHVIGEFCDRCEDGYFNVTDGCPPCQCDLTGTSDLSLPCNYETGRCMCKPGVGGRDCDRCLPGFFNFTSDGCQPCECVESGSMSTVCDASGRCPCKDTVVGVKCDVCRDGYHNIEDGCISCSQCYSLVDRQYQEAVSLYVRLINIINKLEEGDSDTSTGLLLDPHIIRAISSYRSVLEGQLERALSLLARETNATSVLNAILASLENITSQSDRLNEAITSAGLSAEESERFVADSRRILSGLGNTVRFIEQSLSESEVLLMSVGDFYNRTAENLDMLMDLSEIINTTSHEQFTHAREILSRANEALDRAIRAYVMLCNAWDLQNATLDTLSQINVVELKEKLRRASASFKDAKADVPLVLQNALTILRNLQAIPVSDFGISSFRSQLDSLHYRHNDTTTDSAVLDAENIVLYTEAQSLKIQADHLYNWSKRLDLLARELLVRVHVARATARRGYELGQSSINETELLLNLTKEKLREVEEFQSKLRSLLSLLRTARNWTYSALNESKASQELVSLIETIIADGISTIGNAVVLSESALMRAFDANTLATETLVNTNKLRQRSQKLKNQTEDTDARLESVDQRVTEDSRTIADLNTTAVMLETFGQEVAQRLKAVTARVDDLSMQYDRIPFVGAMEIDSLNKDITAAEELVEEIERDLKELRVRQGRLNKSTEEMEGKYELLKHHRQLLRKIRDSVKDLDCEGGS